MQIISIKGDGVRKATKVITTMAVVWIMALSAAGPASAEDSVTRGKSAAVDEGALPSVRTAIMGLQVTGFDADVAERNGYQIVTLADGKRASVPKGVASAAIDGTIKPAGQDTEYGDCGYSYVELYNRGGGRGELRTGWHTNRNATSYTWVTEVWQGSPVAWPSWSGSLALRDTWTSGLFYRNFRIGATATYQVIGPLSYVMTWTGTICTSLGPWTFEGF